MIRVLLEELLPLLLPTLVYLLWWAFFGRQRRTVTGETKPWYDGPWFWLILAGVGLSGAMLFYTAMHTGGAPTGTFVAPRYQDGRVIPGHIDDRR